MYVGSLYFDFSVVECSIRWSMYVYVCIYLFWMDRPRPGEGLQEQVFEMDAADEVDCGNQVPCCIFLD